MKEETNEDARTKQDLLYECSSLESKLSNEIIKNENLEQQCKKQKEVIDNIKKCFDDGHFEDYCDCLIIEKYINNYLKEASE